jgi:predicted transcriptional regulator
LTEELYSSFAPEPVLLRRERASLRRSHLEIRMDILTCIQAGIEKPTQIMYKANLSWTALKEHLDALMASSLLREVEYGSRRKYELTEKALSVLAAYRKVVNEIQGAPEKKQIAF